LDEQNLRDETLVVFTSDNGPAITSLHPYGSSGPLRSKKGFLYEGGIRVPGIVRWPGKVQAGSESDQPVCGVDLLPTLCGLTGAEIPQDRVIDGTDLRPLFSGESIRRNKPLYWQFHYANSGPQVAMREGDWKLVGYTDGPRFRGTADLTEEAMEHINSAHLKSFELYNLKNDIGETTDLAAKEPARVNEMSKRMNEMLLEIQKENPTWPVWTSPRYESKRIIWETDARKQSKAN
ncbi:MAG: sulfatase-like hydrolase/transferase, partial [Planctomycetaceae bacterium]|nr:sulfatase-like hydrolase/transferase [Planctomycetaceae bacterium]